MARYKNISRTLMRSTPWSSIWTLEEIVRHAAVLPCALLVRWRIELQEGVLQMLVDLHHGCLIATAVAVVRRREDGHDVPVVAPIVTLHDQLMSASDELQTIDVIELLRDVLAKRVASAAWR